MFNTYSAAGSKKRETADKKKRNLFLTGHLVIFNYNSCKAMTKKSIYIVLGIVCLLIIGIIGYYWYQKPRQSLVDVPAQYTLSATQLYLDFSTNEGNANKKFIEKVILVEGEIQQIESSDTTINILLKGGEMGGVNCTLSSNNALPKPLPVQGAHIRLKGKCIGFLMNVNIVDAVIEN